MREREIKVRLLLLSDLPASPKAKENGVQVSQRLLYTACGKMCPPPIPPKASLMSGNRTPVAVVILAGRH